MHTCRTVLVLAGSLTVAAAAAGESANPVFTYNHRSGADVTYTLTLKSGSKFTIVVENTCPTEFDYRMVGVTKPPAPASTLRKGGKAPLTTVNVEGKYDSEYAGYDLQIRAKEQPARCIDATNHEVTDLKPVTVHVIIKPIEWEVGQDAALTLTAQVSRAWTTIPTSEQVTTTDASGRSATASVTRFKVVRDKDGEDQLRVNFATMTHFYRPNQNWGPALGFGLVDNNVEYYFGVGGGVGERNRRVLNWIVGAVYTPINRLPAGIKEDDLLADAASLKDFRKGHVVRPFVGITATFFRSSGNEQKPVATPQ